VNRAVLKASPVDAGKVRRAYGTKYGDMYHGRIEDALQSAKFRSLKGKVNLVLTSPPFPLVKKKKYGNEVGEQYLAWLSKHAVRTASQITAGDGRK